MFYSDLFFFASLSFFSFISQANFLVRIKQNIFFPQATGMANCLMAETLISWITKYTLGMGGMKWTSSSTENYHTEHYIKCHVFTQITKKKSFIHLGCGIFSRQFIFLKSNKKKRILMNWAAMVWSFVFCFSALLQRSSIKNAVNMDFKTIVACL